MILYNIFDIKPSTKSNIYYDNMVAIVYKQKKGLDETSLIP